MDTAADDTTNSTGTEFLATACMGGIGYSDWRWWRVRE